MLIPLESVSGGTMSNYLLYMALIGVLLLIGTIIRLKVSIFKTFYIPAALIAGVIGLILGPSVLKVIPQEITNSWSTVAGFGMTIVLAPAMMGAASSKKKGMYKKAINAACFTYGCTGIQFALPMLLTLLVLNPVFHVGEQFATTFECAWAGSHGMAAAMKTVYDSIGYEGGDSLCLVNATIGLLFGLIGGIALINVAARKGWTKCLGKTTGGLKLKNTDVEIFHGTDRPVDTLTATSSNVIDTFAFHAAILGVILIVGQIISYLLRLIGVDLPLFCCAVFAGFFTQKVLDKTPWADVVDRNVFSRMQGIALEFVLVGSVASLNLSVVAANIVPILIVSVPMAVIMWLMVTKFAPKVLGYYWFETAMILFGAFTGAAATGMTLLKVCDPKVQSDAAEIYAARLIFTGFATGGGVITLSAPLWVAKFGMVPCMIGFILLTVVALAIPFVFKLNKFEGVESQQV